MILSIYPPWTRRKSDLQKGGGVRGAEQGAELRSQDLRTVEGRRHVLGHDTTTDIGRAGWRYERLRKFIRKKGWHIGRPNWRSELLNAVARKTGVNPATLDDYAHRGARKKI